MSRLELKVPPDIVWVVVAALMWVASVRAPRLGVPSPLSVTVAVVIVIAGVWVIISARVSLERADTTWRPLTPGQTTSLVTSGVYRISRNPIYLGMWLVLLGWAVALASPLALVLSATFVVYLDRFQIRPEERALSAILGQDYLDYLKRVRRWI